MAAQAEKHAVELAAQQELQRRGHPQTVRARAAPLHAAGRPQRRAAKLPDMACQPPASVGRQSWVHTLASGVCNMYRTAKSSRASFVSPQHGSCHVSKPLLGFFSSPC